jgi:hypothetical protein
VRFKCKALSLDLVCSVNVGLISYGHQMCFAGTVSFRMLIL